MKKNFKHDNKKMVWYEIHGVNIISTKGNSRSNIGKYTLQSIHRNLRSIITQNLQGSSNKKAYKEMKKLLRTFQKHSSFQFGYTICHPNDNYNPHTGYKHALHNYLESQK